MQDFENQIAGVLHSQTLDKVVRPVARMVRGEIDREDLESAEGPGHRAAECSMPPGNPSPSPRMEPSNCSWPPIQARPTGDAQAILPGYGTDSRCFSPGRSTPIGDEEVIEVWH